MSKTLVQQDVLCDHCGAVCPTDPPSLDANRFCCNGCKAVYELLHAARMSSYYERTATPGLRPPEADSGRFAYLDDPEIRRKLIGFTDGETTRVQFSIPQMHCVSCIWLLEHLNRLEPAIHLSQANFLRRELTAVFDESAVSLRALVELLARLGYEPHIRLDSLEPKKSKNHNQSLYLKLGVAGFAAGNIMLMSFPGYFGSGAGRDPMLVTLFSYACLVLALPVLLYSAGDYFRSAIRGLRSRTITIEVPLAIGLLVLFGRSLYDIFSGLGPGYLDSFSGLVFFLLLGRLFQQRTYERLSFDRDYRAYFPVAITKRTGDAQTAAPITSLVVGDRIVVRHQELVPADSVLISGEGHIDYSFVTGEAEPKLLVSGAMIFAGGRQVGGAIELEVVREVSQSYLTSLWTNSVFQKKEPSTLTSLANKAGKYFTIAILLVAAATAAYWMSVDPAKAMNAVTAVLIVACPCALALSSPFALGAAQRILDKHSFYLRSSATIETMTAVDSIVVDKTGTLTESDSSAVKFDGAPLSAEERSLVASLATHSNHPVSRRLAQAHGDAAHVAVSEFKEIVGEGTSGAVKGRVVRIGKRSWVSEETTDEILGSGTFLSIDGRVRGMFTLSGLYREGVASGMADLANAYDLAVLSGDNDSQRLQLEKLLGEGCRMIFEQSPHDKLAYIVEQQEQGHTVMMIGDGLNDAGALWASDVGVAITENSSAFSPACSAILDARSLGLIGRFLQFAGQTRSVILASFVISIIYNITGLGFAVTGRLSPLVSAVLMPLSSITVVLFATLATRVQARRLGL